MLSIFFLGTGAIAEALKTNTFLTSLNLGDNGIMKEGVQALASMLNTNTKLMRLDVSKNAVLYMYIYVYVYLNHALPGP